MTKIRNISDLLKNLKHQNTDKLWFRGQADMKWKLLPGMLRGKVKYSEVTFMNKFKQSATLLLQRLPASNFDWLFLMQHYKIATRLLDWTESPLVALYFSVIEHKTKDGILWVLDPVKLNIKANIKDDNSEGFIPSFEDPYLDNYDPIKLNQEGTTHLLPIGCIAKRNSARMQAQLGVFTIHHRNKIAIEDISESGKNHIECFVIPAASKKKIFEELKLLGITKFQLFPELENISNLI